MEAFGLDHCLVPVVALSISTDDLGSTLVAFRSQYFFGEHLFGISVAKWFTEHRPACRQTMENLNKRNIFYSWYVADCCSKDPIFVPEVIGGSMCGYC